ncbi:MAG: SMP-30/gluconolactonase/LRE family protein [Polyangiaceae bacterium]|nr:SMP-30/gluconolactonase/LRE family protein [Polyangiaceae bacterium]
MTRFALALVLGTLLAATSACGSDDEPTSSASGGAGGASSGGSSGSGGATGGGGGSGGSATGGTSGSGGAVAPDAGFVDPTAGVGPAVLVQGGFTFLEGPAWHKPTSTLYFSDIPANAIFALTGAGPATPFRTPSGNSNGLAFDTQGRLVACEHSGRRLSRSTGGNPPQTVVDSHEGKTLNSPNDVIVRSDGTLYFTDPAYGGNPNVLGFQGVFRVTPAGVLHLVDASLPTPNGVALSPDESVLYVADTQQALVRRYDVASDGTTSNPAKFTDTSASADGMAVDVQGYLYVTTTAGVEVYAPDGSLHDTLSVPEIPANCAFGGADGKTLFVTARKGLYRFELNVPGLGLP